MADLWGSPNEIDDFAMEGDEQFNPEFIAQQAEAEQVQEPSAPPVAQDRPRDENGRFAKTEDAGTAEAEAPAVEAPAEPTVEVAAAETAEQPLILGKFKSVDDLATAYERVQQNEGRLAQEVGDLRKIVEERLAAQAAPQPQAPQAPQQIDVQAARDWLEENPAQIQTVLAQAFDQGNDQLVAVALRAWEDTGDTIGAEQARMMVATARAARAISEQNAALAQQQTARSGELQNLGQRFAQEHPDVTREEMTSAAERAPKLAKLLDHQDPQVVWDALETLYDLAKAGPPEANRPDTTQIARDLGREAALAAEQAIKDATVASATTAVAAPTKSRAAELTEGWDQFDDPLARGWNVGR